MTSASARARTAAMLVVAVVAIRGGRAPGRWGSGFDLQTAEELHGWLAELR